MSTFILFFKAYIFLEEIFSGTNQNLKLENQKKNSYNYYLRKKIENKTKFFLFQNQKWKKFKSFFGSVIL